MKKTLIFILIIVIIGLSLVMFVHNLFEPEKIRNISTTDIQLRVELNDLASREPIIRTFTKDEFMSFSDRKIDKIHDEVRGNIEGDIPQVIIENGLNQLKFIFQKSQGEDISIIKPDNIPDIELSIIPTIYSDEEPVIFHDLLFEVLNEDIYLYEIGNYLDDKGEYYEGENPSYGEAMFIKIDFRVEGNDYISIFAINTSKNLN